MSEMYSTEQQFLRNVDIFGYGFFGLTEWSMLNV